MRISLLLLFSVTALATDPTYTSDIKPIFKNRCSLCHNYMAEKNWQKYEDAFAHRKEIKEKMVTKAMPPNGTEMPQSERDLIIKWVDTGAKQ